jgi:hypothetical protein
VKGEYLETSLPGCEGTEGRVQGRKGKRIFGFGKKNIAGSGGNGRRNWLPPLEKEPFGRLRAVSLSNRLRAVSLSNGAGEDLTLPLTFGSRGYKIRTADERGTRRKIENHPAGKDDMSTNVEKAVKKTVNSVLVTLDRCGRYELAATVLRKGMFVALINTPEIESYSKTLQEKGLWQSLQHSTYGILIDTQLPVPEHYGELESHAKSLAVKFASIEQWYDA